MDYVDQFEDKDAKMSFLDHLDILRKHLWRSTVAVLIMAVVAFLNKGIVFDQIILGPKKASFITYRFFCDLASKFEWLGPLCFPEPTFSIANIEMTGQFMQHMTVSLFAGIILAFPYVIYQIWVFIKPALKTNERKYATGFIFWVSVLFFLGISFGYFFIAPISIMFLGSYQVSEMVANQITLSSYISTLTMLTLASGLIFELPMLMYFLAKVEVVSASFLRQYRKIAFVINLVVSAIITPSDVGSMILMAIPLVILYEISILLVQSVEKKRIQF